LRVPAMIYRRYARMIGAEASFPNRERLLQRWFGSHELTKSSK
jgi:hypothetical protein